LFSFLGEKTSSLTSQYRKQRTRKKHENPSLAFFKIFRAVNPVGPTFVPRLRRALDRRYENRFGRSCRKSEKTKTIASPKFIVVEGEKSKQQRLKPKKRNFTPSMVICGDRCQPIRQFNIGNDNGPILLMEAHDDLPVRRNLK
jgi:hypothetical protein